MEITKDLLEAITSEFERDRFFGEIKLEIDQVSIDNNDGTVRINITATLIDRTIPVVQ